jgi:hypothetical protein
MEHQRLARVVGVVFLMSAMAGAGAQPCGRYSLRQWIAVGDRQLWESTGEVSLTLTARSGGQETPLAKASNRFQDKYREDVLAARSGAVTALRHHCLLSRTLATDPEGNPVSDPSSLQGKTFTVARLGASVVIRPAGAAISAEDRAQLVRALQEVRIPFLPERDAALGDEWTIPASRVKIFFPQARAGTMKARFEEITRCAGRRCARIHLEGELELAIDGVPAPVKADLTGELYHALDIHRPVALEFSGPLTVNSPAEQDGHPTTLTGEGQMTAKVTIQWEKLAGKPVAPRKAPAKLAAQTLVD